MPVRKPGAFCAATHTSCQVAAQTRMDVFLNYRGPVIESSPQALESVTMLSLAGPVLGIVALRHSCWESLRRTAFLGRLLWLTAWKGRSTNKIGGELELLRSDFETESSETPSE